MREAGRWVPRRRALLVQVVRSQQTNCVGAFGTGYLQPGDGYIVLAGKKVLLTQAQLAELFGGRVG
jgi:hypothetical protein